MVFCSWVLSKNKIATSINKQQNSTSMNGLNVKYFLFMFASSLCAPFFTFYFVPHSDELRGGFFLLKIIDVFGAVRLFFVTFVLAYASSSIFTKIVSAPLSFIFCSHFPSLSAAFLFCFAANDSDIKSTKSFICICHTKRFLNQRVLK